MITKICKQCGKQLPETRFKTLRVRSDGSYKRSNICNRCKTTTLSNSFPHRIVFTDHAKDRCILRKVDVSRLTRSMYSLKLKGGEHKVEIPNTPLVVIYNDDINTKTRTIITVIVST